MLQVSAVAALISLAHTRLRVRHHPHHENGPRSVKSARNHAMAMLAEAAALDALPLSSEEMRRWATWVEAGAEDRDEDLVLARLLARGLNDGVVAVLHIAISTSPRCVGNCACETQGCTHGCAQHNLGGEGCSVCKCGAFSQSTSLDKLFRDALELAVSPPKDE